MVNRVAGEIHKKGGILQQTFGETVANAYGLVFYQAADGKLYRAQGKRRRLSPASFTSARTQPRSKTPPATSLAQGRAEKTGWSWTVGKLVYVSPTTAGGLTQTVPTGTQKIRPVGFATRSDQIDFRPLWGTGASYTVNIDGIAATKGDILVRSATAWGAVPGTTIGVHPLVPDLRNRILRIKDGASTPNDLEIHQVWIPFFRSAGFSQPNLNGIICGGFWVDKFQACMPAATATSRGGLTPNSPGAGVGAASKPHVVPWTDVSWNTARAALENRGGAANKSADGTPTACAMYATGDHPRAEFLVDSVDHLVGRRVEIVQGGTTYFRRIIKAGKFGEAKYVRVFPELPATLTTDDTYTIVGHHMITPDEQFALAAWAMTFRYRHGLSYPKGNNDYGKDIGDPRAIEYEGLTDPVLAGDETHEKRRCLTGQRTALLVLERPCRWCLGPQRQCLRMGVPAGRLRWGQLVHRPRLPRCRDYRHPARHQRAEDHGDVRRRCPHRRSLPEPGHLPPNGDEQQRIRRVRLRRLLVQPGSGHLCCDTGRGLVAMARTMDCSACGV
jgi:hypothetical protein